MLDDLDMIRSVNLSAVGPTSTIDSRISLRFISNEILYVLRIGYFSLNYLLYSQISTAFYSDFKSRKGDMMS